MGAISAIVVAILGRELMCRCVHENRSCPRARPRLTFLDCGPCCESEMNSQSAVMMCERFACLYSWVTNGQSCPLVACVGVRVAARGIGACARRVCMLCACVCAAVCHE